MSSEISTNLLTWAVIKFGSISKFADAMGMSQQALSPYINGKRKLSQKMVNKVYQLGCDINWLFGYDKEEKYNELLRTVNELKKENKELKDRLNEILKAAKGR